MTNHPTTTSALQVRGMFDPVIAPEPPVEAYVDVDHAEVLAVLALLDDHESRAADAAYTNARDALLERYRAGGARNFESFVVGYLLGSTVIDTDTDRTLAARTRGCREALLDIRAAQS